MAIFDKFNDVSRTIQFFTDFGASPVNVVMERIISATEGIVKGRRTILAGTNNYLGLTFNKECIDAACAALGEEGTGTTGSRMANGTYSGHIQLERELAEFFGCKGAIIFSTGYAGILGMISALAGPRDIVIIDADCHASIYDSCRLSGAEFMRFRHNDVSDLDKRLSRLGDRATNALIVVEGIYSMLGNRANIKEIAAVKSKYGAYLMVDEAHSLGVLGKQGRGVTEDAGVENQVDFIVGTFSKSLGSIGGFCVSNHPELNLVRYASRPYIFTASSSPSIIASTRAALKVLRTRPELRARLWENAVNLYDNLKEMGFALGPEPSPVVSIHIETKEKALTLWKALLDQGVYVNMVLPPATPSGNPLLRCSMSAAHTPEQVAHICRAFASVRAIANA
jgi:8-amino-7-oxononanoate synthase